MSDPVPNHSVTSIGSDNLSERASPTTPSLMAFHVTYFARVAAFIVIVIAIYGVVARERDRRWISPDFIERRGR